MLPLLILAQNRDYNGAELRTLESFQYGRFETRLQSGQGDGFLSSFFIYNDDYPATPWAEIDIEVLGRWPDNMDVNVIDEQGSHLRQHPLNTNPALGFHDYAFEWTPDYVAWFFDDAEIYRQTGAHIDDLSEPGKLMMNIWNPVYADWVGTWDERILPRFAWYDRASYASYTPGAGNVGSNQNFSLEWVDEFDGLDTNRWERSHGHTWNGNQALMIAENAVIEDGKLVLCLTTAGNSGLGDVTAPFALWARAFSEDSMVVRFSEELDPVTAQAISSYAISGISLDSVLLHADQRTVSLQVRSLNLDSNYSLVILGLRDDAEPPNTQLGQVIPVQMPRPLQLPVRIDCGGPGRQEFLPDQDWSAATEYGHEGGNPQQLAAFPDYPETEIDSVLATSLNRFSRYHVRLAPGTFDLQLHFAENSYTQSGQRSFEIHIEDSLYVTDLDVVAEVGPRHLYTLSVHDLAIRDGSLDILCAANLYGLGYGYAGPFLNAIEINGQFNLGLGNDIPVLPHGFDFEIPVPNPFNASTRFRFSVPDENVTQLQILDIRGRVVDTLFSREFSAGKHAWVWHPDQMASGIYFARLSQDQNSIQHKLLILK